MGRSPPTKIGELPKPGKQRVSTVQPLAGRPTGCDVLIYCLNHRLNSGREVWIKNPAGQLQMKTSAGLEYADFTTANITRFIPVAPAANRSTRFADMSRAGLMNLQLSLSLSIDKQLAFQFITGLFPWISFPI